MLRKRECGFTMVELLIALVVLFVVINFATLNWQGFVERQQGRQLRTHLRTTFQVARYEAIRNNRLVTMCPLDTTNNCVSAWEGPITVFLDQSNQKALLNPNDIIRTFESLEKGSLKASKSGPYERRYFQFNPDGTVHGSIGNLTWCPTSKFAQRGFQVVVNFAGRIRWAQDRDHDGVVENASGDPISCA